MLEWFLIERFTRSRSFSPGREIEINLNKPGKSRIREKTDEPLAFSSPPRRNKSYKPSKLHQVTAVSFVLKARVKLLWNPAAPPRYNPRIYDHAKRSFVCFDSRTRELLFFGSFTVLDKEFSELIGIKLIVFLDWSLLWYVFTYDWWTFNTMTVLSFQWNTHTVST